MIILTNFRALVICFTLTVILFESDVFRAKKFLRDFYFAFALINLPSIENSWIWCTILTCNVIELEISRCQFSIQ